MTTLRKGMRLLSLLPPKRFTVARPSIAQIKALGDFATVFRWNISFIGASGGDAINLRCESIDSLPKITNQKIEANIRGHKFFQAGIGQYNNTIQLTCVETVNNYVHTFFKSLRDSSWAAKTGMSKGLAPFELKIQRLDNADQPIWDYKLFGVFLEDYEAGTLDGSSSEFLKPTLTFSYDYFQDGPPGYAT